MAPEVLLVTDEAMLAHDPGEAHPERPARLARVLARLRERPVRGTRFVAASRAPTSALERIHSHAYVGAIEALAGRSTLLDADTALSPGTVEAAFLSAGAAIEATRAVVRGEARRAFALARPPGHHAEAAQAMGFCFFNNVAVAAAHARAELGCERVLVVDWDVHHGNGTQHVFERRRDVLFFSTHRYPFYPGTGGLEETGLGEGVGYTVNVPLPPALGDADYAATFRELLAPIAESYRPDLVLVSAGFDPHRDDPLGDMEVTDEGFAALCGAVSDIADAHAKGRLVLVLEGGYDVEALSRSVHSCVQVLAGAEPPGAPGHRRGDRALAAARDVHRRYWKL